jgi:hypothetical protein
MPHQYRTFSITVPAQTLQATPQTFDISFGTFEVRNVNVRVPPGPLGTVGFRIASSRVQWIPWNTGAWLVFDDESRDFPADGWPNSGDWQIVAYNVGLFSHTLEFTWELDPVMPAPVPVVGISASDLSTLTVPAPAPALSPSDVLAGPPPAEFDVNAPLP